MNSYYALRYLNNELKAKLKGYVFVKAVTSRKNFLELIFASDGDEQKLTVCTNPVNTAFFLDARVSVKKSNSVSFFEDLEGCRMTDHSIAESDRIITFQFENGLDLVFRLFGGDPNALLIRDDKIIETFKNPDKNIGNTRPMPRPPAAPAFSETKGNLKQRIFRAYPLFSRPLVPDLIRHGDLKEKNDEEITQWLNAVENQIRNHPVPRILSDGRFAIISDEFIPDPEDEKFDSVHDAVRVAFYQQGSRERFDQVATRLTQRLDQQEKKLRNLIQASDNANKSLERAEKYERMGNLLMANAHRQPDEENNIEVEDFYDDNKPLKIPLKPGTEIAENATNYFEKKKKAERSYEALLEQGNQAAKKLDALLKIRKEFDGLKSYHEIQAFQEKYSGVGYLFSAQQDQKETVRPFRVLQLGKYEVWLGKNAKSNDAIVRDAHKEDIWMHARGVSGSHLVLRMNKAVQDPDMSVIERAASWAASNSKARGSELVPVIWTRKKFVRKPKGAAAGAVLVQKEKVVMVSPAEP